MVANLLASASAMGAKCCGILCVGDDEFGHISLNDLKLLKEVIINQNKTEVIVPVREETITNETQELLNPKTEVKEVSSDTKSQKWIIQDSDEIYKTIISDIEQSDVEHEYFTIDEPVFSQNNKLYTKIR